MNKYIKDKSGDTIYRGLILPEHTPEFVKSFGGYEKYHKHLMEMDRAAPVYELIDGISQVVGLRLINHPLIHEQVKVKRNDLCPCKSGKKYKKCCMNK